MAPSKECWNITGNLSGYFHRVQSHNPTSAQFLFFLCLLPPQKKKKKITNKKPKPKINWKFCLWLWQWRREEKIQLLLHEVGIPGQKEVGLIHLDFSAYCNYGSGILALPEFLVEALPGHPGFLLESVGALGVCAVDFPLNKRQFAESEA